MFSPRVWGWSVLGCFAKRTQYVLPTRVGMVRDSPASRSAARRSPHACGDGPHCRLALPSGAWFSPRVWGWSAPTNRRAARRHVLPTRVGMVRNFAQIFREGNGSPHACGDGPSGPLSPPTMTQFSPRVWGWSGQMFARGTSTRVLPTRVGMVRICGGYRCGSFRSPHACGDGPGQLPPPVWTARFSPRVWGWSERKPAQEE